jgi:O-antigen/teichoic acid export membrane protein
MSAILVMLALPLAAFYMQPELASVLAALALYPVLQALRSPGMPVLRRQLNYRALFIDEVGQTLVSVVVTLACGWAWHSVWAMVAGVLAGATGGVVISYLLCPMRPRWGLDRSAVHGILHISRQVFVNTLLMALWFNSDRLLGLRLVSLEEMGLYAVAWNLACVLEGLQNRACDVYFSVLSQSTDTPQLAEWHDRNCARLALAAMPVMALGVLASPWVVHILYDPRYAGASLLFAVLAARLMLRSLGQLQFQYLLAQAEINVATVAYAVALLVQAVLIVPLAQRWGGLGLAVAALMSTIVVTFVQCLLLWWRSQSRMAPFFITLGWTLLVVVPLLAAN